MDNKCKDGVCEYKKEVRTSQSVPIGVSTGNAEVLKTSIKKSDNSEKEEKELNLENIIKKASANPQQRKNQKKYHRASSDCDSSDEEKDEPYYHGSKASTTLTREQALKLSLRKMIDERKLNK